MSIESHPGQGSQTELSRAHLLARRALRPQTYFRLGHEIVDRVCTWPKVNATVDARAGERGNDFFFVQVGANDGKRADPINTRIREQQWKGLLVEPLPQYFNELQRTYAGQEGLQFAQVAVSHENGKATMFAINDTDSMLRGSSSLSREVIDNSAWVVKDIDALVEPVTVPTQRLETLLGEFGVRDIDYLVVDTEGHDAVVVNQALDLERPPHMVLYEHMHLPSDDRLTLENRLDDAGYGIRHLRRDTFAWQLEA